MGKCNTVRWLFQSGTNLCTFGNLRNHGLRSALKTDLLCKHEIIISVLLYESWNQQTHCTHFWESKTATDEYKNAPRTPGLSNAPRKHGFSCFIVRSWVEKEHTNITNIELHLINTFDKVILFLGTAHVNWLQSKLSCNIYFSRVRVFQRSSAECSSFYTRKRFLLCVISNILSTL